MDPPRYTDPIVTTYTTPELSSILSRSNFSSLSQLLSPFSSSSSTSPIQLRSPNYDTRTVPSFPLHYISKPLPTNWDTTSTTSTSKQSLTPNPQSQSPGGLGQSDEIFLDLLSTSISSKIDSIYLSSPPPLLQLSPTPPIVKQLYDIEGTPLPTPTRDSRLLPEGDLTPWYSEFKDKVFERKESNPFESWNWPICCVLALSTSNRDPLNALSSLWDLTSTTSPPTSTPGQEYVNRDCLRYILLVHDVKGEVQWEESKKLEDLVKKTYGVHVGLIPLFSGGSQLAHEEARKLWPVQREREREEKGEVIGLGYELTSNSLHERNPSIVSNHQVRVDEMEQKGLELSLDDFERLKTFSRELIVQSIVPWIERTVTVLNEQFTSNKKSLGGRLFSVGRSYFGRSTPTPPTRPGSPSPSGGFNSQKGYYESNSPESQSRRLADLLFVLRDYKLAGKVYEELVKDFKSQPGASNYLNSALRMQGICSLLSHLTQSTPLPHLPSQSPDQYLLQSLPPSPIPPSLDLLRSTMHYHQLYSLLPQSTQILSKLAELVGEDEVWSALFLEQSAIRYIQRGMKRKGARELISSGKRYEKCGIKSLSRRCLAQASTIYSPPSSSTPSSSTSDPSSSSFNSIRSHLNHSLGIQAYNLGKPLEAIQHFLQLLSSTTSTGEGEGQVDWLEDFELAWDLLVQQQGGIEVEGFGQELPRGLFERKGVRVERKERDGEVDDGEGWRELEEKIQMAMGKGNGKGKGKLNDGLLNGQALVGGTFHLELPVRNPLENFLSIGGLTIKHRRKRIVEGQETVESDLEVDQTVEGEIIELAPLESRIIYVPIRGHSEGIFEFVSISYRFHNLLPITESLSTPIPRKTTLAQLNLDREPVPTVLPSVTLRPPIPILTISSFEGSKGRLVHGQSLIERVKVRNDGQVGMSKLRVMSSNPEVTLFRPDGLDRKSEGREGSVRVGNEIRDNASVDLVEELGPGEEREIEVVVKGNQVGSVEVKWLFAYESIDESSEVFSTKTTQSFEVQPSLEFRYSTRPSIRDDFPFMLNLEAYNAGIPASDLRITSVSLLSPMWKLSTLPGLTFEDLASSPLAWQQLSNLAFAINPIEQDTSDADPTTEWSVRQVEGLLQGKKIEESKPGEINLECSNIPSISNIDLSTDSSLLPSLIASHSHHRSQSLSSQFPTVPLSLLHSIFPLFSSTSAVILIQFSSPSLDISGTHYLPLTSLGASSNVLREVLTTAELKAGGLYEESQRERTTLIRGLRGSELGREEDPANVGIEVEGIKEHDFNQGPCSLPVTFRIRNLSTTNSFDYLLQLGTTSDSALIYTGLLTRWGTIPPLSLVQISTKAFISREGIYDLGGWTLTVNGKDGRRNWVQNGEKREIRVRGKEREKGLESVRMMVPVVA